LIKKIFRGTFSLVVVGGGGVQGKKEKEKQSTEVYITLKVLHQISAIGAAFDPDPPKSSFL
jgi:hypothetical protein